MITMKVEVYNDGKLLDSIWLPIQQSIEHRRGYDFPPTDGMIALTSYKLGVNVVDIKQYDLIMG